MLYHAYQAQIDAFAPVRLMAEALSGIFDQRWFGDVPEHGPSTVRASEIGRAHV